MSASTVVEGTNLPLTLLRVHEFMLVDDENQTETLLRPCKVITHGTDLIPHQLAI